MAQSKIKIVVNGKEYDNWETATVSRAMDMIPSTFTFTCTDPYATEEALAIDEGQSCRIFIDNQQVMEGQVDIVATGFGPGSDGVTISGTSILRKLVTSNIMQSPMMINGGGDIETTLNTLIKPTGIGSVLYFSDIPKKEVMALPLSAGETYWQVIDLLCQYYGLIPLDTETGQLMLTDPGKMISNDTLTQGVNIQRGQSTRSISERSTNYYFYWQSQDSMGDIAEAARVSGRAVDPEKSKFNGTWNHVEISPQVITSLEMAQTQATVYANRLWGRSRRIDVTTSGFLDSSGNVWPLNSMVNLNIPRCKVIDKQWLITGLTFNFDRESGETTDITLMPKEAFSTLAVNIYASGLPTDITTPNSNVTPPKAITEQANTPVTQTRNVVKDG